MISQIGLFHIFGTYELSPLQYHVYPPYGLITAAFMPLGEYLIFIGVFASAKHISRDASLRMEFYQSAVSGKSFTVAAFENDIPIYIPAISDSSIGLNMLPLLFDDQPMPFNVINDVAESAAILWKSPKSGALELGGGVPDTGGLSGGTLQEGKSWGKIKTSHSGNVIVYGDASVYFPLLCAYAMPECKPRKQKRIFAYKTKWMKEMKQMYLSKKR